MTEGGGRRGCGKEEKTSCKKLSSLNTTISICLAIKRFYGRRVEDSSSSPFSPHSSAACLLLLFLFSFIPFLSSYSPSPSPSPLALPFYFSIITFYNAIYPLLAAFSHPNRDNNRKQKKNSFSNMFVANDFRKVRPANRRSTDLDVYFIQLAATAKTVRSWPWRISSREKVFVLLMYRLYGLYAFSRYGSEKTLLRWILRNCVRQNVARK